MKNSIKNGLIFFTVLIFLIAVIEASAKIWLEISGDESFPLIYKKPRKLSINHVIRGQTVMANRLDPLLGYSYSGDRAEAAHRLPGFVEYNNVTGDKQAIKIVTLGGSTTDSQMDPDANWPRLLGSLLAQQGIGNVTLNGGIIGYSSNQETIKLIRDVLPLKPDLVISLNGINDLIINDTTPMVTEYQTLMLKKLAGGDSSYLPNSVNALRKLLWGNARLDINEGVEQDADNVLQWDRNVRTMHAVCKEFGIEYLVFLQPTLGIGEYKMEKYDKHLYSIILRTRPHYMQELQSFYSRARERCRTLPYCYDLVDVFAGEKRIYADVRHPNSRGYKIIAEAMASHLETSARPAP